MRNHFKTSFCILLSLILALGITTNVFAESVQIILNPPSKESHSIQTDKSQYAWGDTITFTVAVTNISKDVLTDVRVATDARHPQWFTRVTSDEECVIVSLQPKETASVQIQVETQTLTFSDRLRVFNVLLFDDLQDAFSRMFTGLVIQSYSQVHIGLLNHDFLFPVDYRIASLPPDQPDDPDEPIHPSKNTCTVTIDAREILEHPDKLKIPEKITFVPKNGYIVKDVTMEFRDGESVYDVLRRVCQTHTCTDNCKYCQAEGIQMESTYTPQFDNYYVDGIHQLYEKDCGGMSGWTYWVNGVFPNYGCNQYIVKPGDRVEWIYSIGLDDNETFD